MKEESPAQPLTGMSSAAAWGAGGYSPYAAFGVEAARANSTAERLAKLRMQCAVQGDIKPDEHQQRAIDAFKRGDNILVTGVAGTGKSLVIHLLKDFCRQKYGGEFTQKVAFAAPTGIAAVNVAGSTLHSVMGIGVSKSISGFEVMWEKEKKKHLRALEVIVLDEISMVSACFLSRFALPATSRASVTRPLCVEW
jgi:hypothetical protein